MNASVLDSRRHRLLIAALCAASLVPIWSVEYFPSQNGPWHVLTAKMLRDYSDPTYNYAEYYTSSWHAIPHLLHTTVMYALSLVFPILIANKLAISVYAVLLPLSVFALLSAIDRRQAVLGYASFLFVYNVPLLRGYHDYALGIPVTLLTFAFWWRHRAAVTWTTRLIFIGLTLVVYFSHLFNVAVLGLSVILTIAWERRRVRPVLEAGLMFVPVLLLTTEYFWFSAGNAHWIVPTERVFLPPHLAAEGFFRHFLYTFSHTAYLIAVVTLLVWSHLIFRGLAASWRRWRAGRVPGAVAFALPVLLLTLTALYFATPFKLFGWHYVNVRFVPYVLVFALTCAVRVGYRRGTVLAATMSVAAFAVYGLLTYQFVRANDVLSEYLSGIEIVERNKTLLPIMFQRLEIGEISPIAHAHDYYHVYRGGANGFGIAVFNTVTPLIYRSYPVRDRFPDRHADLGAISRAYDYIILWDDAGFATRTLSTVGFDVVHKRGRLKIVRNRFRTVDDTTAVSGGGGL